MDEKDFRRFGHQLIDWIADYREGLAARPVMSPVEPGSVRAQLPKSAPEAPEPFEEVLADLEKIVLPALTHFQHPKFFGFFPANATLESVLGDLASTGLGVIGLTWQSSPALTEIEEVVTDWMRQALGLGEEWRGVIHDTASSASLVAMLSAREKALNYGAAKGGLQAHDKPLMVYSSAQAHSSIDKAALLAGFGRDNIRHIAEDENFALSADLLQAAIDEDRKLGRQPAAIIAGIGTTTTTAFDPLEKIAAIAKREGLWLHVDAAMAGSAMILPECRHLWAGVEGADSLVLNPHKWLGAAFDCSLYYVRDPQHLIRVMATNPSYLQSAVDQAVTSYRDWGVPLGRRFRALKLWFLLREQGLEKLRQRLRRDLENARWLEEQVAQAPHWKILAPVQLQTLCLRHEPAGLSGDELERHTQAWAQRLNASGRAYVTPARLEGRWMVRVSIGAHTTERAHVAELWAEMQAAVKG